ncbi:MAG: HAD-IA family hydrolase [Actinomycetes bacterium]|jgi:putative hydrolase of the HAD superfamily
MQALVLDFGGPVLKTPFELLRAGEERAGLAPGALNWTGPFDPESDADWQAMQAFEITERTYWQRKADHFAELTGAKPTFKALMDVLFDIDEELLVRPEALRLIADARAAGFRIAVLTNDMRAFHGDAWVARMRVLDQVDVLVDGSVEHVLKPHPEIYLLLLERLELSAGECLFLDDQPLNIAGAETVGMNTVWFDVLHPVESYAAVRQILGLVG